MKANLYLDASIVATTFNQSVETIISFIDHQLFCINRSSFSVELILVFESTESEKYYHILSYCNNNACQSLVSLLLNNHSSGFPACLNFGISQSMASYILRTDTDDIMSVERIDNN